MMTAMFSCGQQQDTRQKSNTSKLLNVNCCLYVVGRRRPASEMQPRRDTDGRQLSPNQLWRASWKVSLSQTHTLGLCAYKGRQNSLSFSTLRSDVASYTLAWPWKSSSSYFFFLCAGKMERGGDRGISAKEREKLFHIFLSFVVCTVKSWQRALMQQRPSSVRHPSQQSVRSFSRPTRDKGTKKEMNKVSLIAPPAMCVCTYTLLHTWMMCRSINSYYTHHKSAGESYILRSLKGI